MTENKLFRLLVVFLFFSNVSPYYFPDGPPYQPVRRSANHSEKYKLPEPKQISLNLDHEQLRIFSLSSQDDDHIQEKIPVIETNFVKPEPRLENGEFLKELHQRNSTTKKEGKQSTTDPCDSIYVFAKPGDSALFQSPNYPRNYPNNVRSTMCFSSPEGTKISISCDIFNVEYQKNCAYDFLGLALNGNPASIQKYCGRGKLSKRTTDRNSLAIVFRSDSSNPKSSRRNPYRFNCLLKTTDSVQTTTSPPTSGCSCGRRNDGRIVGGVDAKPNELPWRCYLRTNRFQFFCGCSIISNTWIMTAAHCTEAVMPLPNGDTLYVVVGAHDRSLSTEATSEQIAVASYHDHPDYDDETMENDISLLKLNRSITYSNAISPVCLPFKFVGEDFKGTTVTASGWGTTSQGGAVSNTLKEVELPILTTEECTKFFPGQITDKMICTYNPGKDTCQGDSGGSIDLNREGRFYSIGVVSWGIGCARKDNPGVYVKVTKFLKWIRSTTGQTFCEP